MRLKEAQGGSWRLMEAHGGSRRLMEAHGVITILSSAFAVLENITYSLSTNFCLLKIYCLCQII